MSARTETENLSAKTKTEKVKSPSSNKIPGSKSVDCVVLIEKLDSTKNENKTKQANLSGFFTKSSDQSQRYVIPVVEETAEQKPPAPPKMNIEIDYDCLEKAVLDKGVVILADDKEFKNHMFGDITEAVHLYNSLVSLYVNDSFLPVSKKKSKWNTTKAVEEKLKLNETVLEYGECLFCFVLKF